MEYINGLTRGISFDSLLIKFLTTGTKKVELAYAAVIVVTMACTGICFILFPYLDAGNLIMIYLLGVLVIALLGQAGPSLFASVLCVLAYDYFFIHPYLSFAISDIQYVFSLIVMLLVAETISYLTIRLRRYNEATRKAELAAEAESFRNSLLMSISHDLRTPLAAIMGSASSMLQPGDHIDKAMVQDLAENIYDQSERLTKLVHNVLQVIRLESGSVRIKKSYHQLEDIVGSAFNKLEMLLDSKPVAMKLPQPMPLIPLDHILIEQVLTNLIENAVKFTPKHSPIEIIVEINNKMATINVGDYGPGLNSNDAIKIFDKFYRGQKPETSGSGIGLGLSICKSIVTVHGGTIWAQNRDEGGAIFSFTLPLTMD